MTRIALCGVGALGSHAALFCRNLEATLVLVDFDRVESKNLLSQAFVKASLGKNKAEAMKAQLFNFYGVKAEAFGVRLGSDNVETVLARTDLVVDCFDNAASRRLTSRFARAHETPLVHAGLSGDGTFGLVRWDERFVADEEDTPGQATCETGAHLPLVALLTAALARVVQDFLSSSERRDALVSLKAVTPSVL